MSISVDQFRKAMGCFATGVAVVTTAGDEGKPYGVTVNSLTSVSLCPLLVLFCLDNRLGGLQSFSQNRSVGISVLGENQSELSRKFASKGTDRSGDFYFQSKNGVPLLKGGLANIECEIVARHPGGDHLIFVAEITAVHISEENLNPLLFFRGNYRLLDSRS